MKRRDERGAVAILTALLAITLIGMAAFVADMGLGYANKRQAQTAADAAALGAAGVYSRLAGACPTIVTAGRTNAETEARTKVGQNFAHMPEGSAARTNAELADFDAYCEDGQLVVETAASTTSPNVFGGLHDVEGDYRVQREGAAVVSAAGAVGAGLRPLALCSRDLAALTVFPSPVMKFEGPSSAPSYAGDPSDCPDANRAGNWWLVNCPEDTGNGDLAANISQGCDAGVSIVPDQPAPGDPALRSHLLDYCNPASAHRESCLTSNPGNSRDMPTHTALRGLVTTGQTIFLPVFCGISACSPGAVSTDGGNNTTYPVFRLLAVRLCAYHFGNRIASNLTGNCATSAFNPHAVDPHRNYLLLTVLQVQVSGDAARATACHVGDPCDTGLRQVSMVAPRSDP